MADENDQKTPFLKRWSQRKLAASREPATTSGTPAPNVADPHVTDAAARASAAAVVDPAAQAALPSVESLSFDSDFTAFLQPEVDESIKRQALRKLFADPRFNVMDGLDVYIDDYNKFEAIPAELVARLNQAKYLFDPPKTRVNEHGHVEDVPEEPVDGAVPGNADKPAVEAAPVQIVDNATNAVEQPATEAVNLPPPSEKT
jgi:Protein of unknown function (DUF3306)